MGIVILKTPDHDYGANLNAPIAAMSRLHVLHRQTVQLLLILRACSRTMVSFAHLWKEETLSDVDVAIRVEGSPADVLVIPAHQAILSSSPYFWAQVQRWKAGVTSTPTADTDGPESGTSRRIKRARTNSSSTVEPPKRPRLQLVLNSHEAVSAADQAAAAESVLAAMYDPSGSSNLAPLDALTDTQLLQAAMIADMVQLQSTCEQAASLLAKSTDLSAAVKQQYMSLPSWPQQLLPLFPAMAAGQPLLGVVSTWMRHLGSQEELQEASLALDVQNILLQQLGELDRVWADPQLSDLLLELPLPAMLLLLSAQNLKVSSEDNVLYTAQAWLDNRSEDRRAVAVELLGRSIRCMQLSTLWMSALAMADAADGGVMQTYLPHIKQYYGMQLLGIDTPESVAEEAPELKASCPCWFEAERQYTPLPNGCLDLQFRIPVSELVAACRGVLQSDDPVSYKLWESRRSPPLQGVCWVLRLFGIETSDGGLRLDLHMQPDNIPENSWVKFRYDFSCLPGQIRKQDVSLPLASYQAAVLQDVFDLGPMAGGWDAAAWADNGLPTDGNLLIELKVSKVRP